MALDSDFVEPAPRQPYNGTSSAVASTSRIADPVPSPTKPRIELLSDSSSDASSSASQAPRQPSADSQATAANRTATLASSSTKVKVFLNSSSPGIPLRIRLQEELSHSRRRTLQIAIKTHGGVVDTRLAYADIIVVDPMLVTPSRKLLKSAKALGQPIPVVKLDYIDDCVAQGKQLDVEDPKYKYDGSMPADYVPPTANMTPGVKPTNGRSPFTESDRQAIVDYFIDRTSPLGVSMQPPQNWR